MVSALGHTPVKWFAPTALWRIPGALRLDGGNGAAGQPTILRFANDQFMEELLGVTGEKPERLAEWVARPETWREPMQAPATAATLQLAGPRLPARGRKAADHRRDAAGQVVPAAANPNLPFKLYQPAHERFYLVSASLVSPQHGLPDQVADRAKREQVGFVVRRLGEGDPNDPNRSEYAFVAGADGFRWQRVAADTREALVENEERLPLFAINYQQCARQRQLLAGVVPVARREAYLAAPGWETRVAASASSEAAGKLRALFEADVAEPWKALIEQSDIFETAFLTPGQTPDGDDERDAQRAEYRSAFSGLREQMQTGSWYLLLDFAAFLQKYLAPVWDHLNGRLGESALNAAERELARAIKAISLSTALRNTLTARYGGLGYRVESGLQTALLAAQAEAENLEAAITPLDLRLAVGAADNPWPGFLFPLAHPGLSDQQIAIAVDQHGPLPLSSGMTPATLDLAAKQARVDALADLVEAALPADPGPLPDLQPRAATGSHQTDAWFVIRCVYERPRCRPAHRVDVSHPTVPFQMASFFDPDAPARPIRIPMPLDVSPAGLRKYKKNTTFMISDMLCGQLKRVRKMTLGDLVLSVLPWPFHKDLPDVGAGGACKQNGLNMGMFCSLSIPIVTLCAMILLIIMVALFDLIFRWLPYLFVCLPIPGLKGKKP